MFPLPELTAEHIQAILPFIGVGLFYRFGYMQQKLASDGQQLAVDRENDPSDLAVEAVRAADGRPLEITVPMPSAE